MPSPPSRSPDSVDRLLTLLRARGEDPVSALEISLEAHRRARSKGSAPPGLAEVLACLPGFPPPIPRACIPVMPPVTRAHMPEAHLDRRPWAAFLHRISLPVLAALPVMTLTMWGQLTQALVWLVILNFMGWRPL